MARNGIAAALAAIFLIAPAWALNESFLKDAPLARLSKDEFKAFWAFAMDTLDTTPDGKTVEWKATKATFTSKITLQRTFTDGTLKCREVTVESDSGDRQMHARYQLCKMGKGWEFRAPSRPAK
jgi:surface antigen